VPSLSLLWLVAEKTFRRFLSERALGATAANARVGCRDFFSLSVQGIGTPHYMPNAK
jgi:hypothetical protein